MKKRLSGWIGEGLKEAAPILLITGQVEHSEKLFQIQGLQILIANMNMEAFAGGALFLLIPFIIAAALKTAQGSSTASLVITSTLVAPLLAFNGH